MGNNKNRFFRNNGGFRRPDNMNMDQEDIKEQPEAAVDDVMPEVEDVESVEEVAEPEADAVAEADKRIADLESQLEKEKKEYLFLMAEFDNFRKRTLREKSEIIKNAGENVLKGLLPIMDDFERGLKAAETTEDSAAVKEGMELIYNKLKKYLAQNGVKEMDPADDVFDTEKHEAISVVPVPDADKKGRILDTVEKGYTINDKVLRHAKVVVAQ